MKNADYWIKRVEELEKAAMENEAEIIKNLQKEFEKAANNIKKEINNWLVRFSVNNQISLKDSKKWLNTSELQELKWNIEEYIKYGEENGIDLIWKKELENASAKIHISRLEALHIQIQNELEKLSYKQEKITESYIMESYKDTYYKLAYELQKGHNVAFQLAVLDIETIKKVISKPWTTDSYTFSDRIWKNKKVLLNNLQKELTQTIIRGKAPDEMIDKITKVMGVNKNKAATLVMTESAFFSSTARKKCFNDLGVEEYEIVATLDANTSEICRDFDGRKFKMTDYKEGVTAPPFHVRCRTTTAPAFKDEFEFGERAARNADGKTYYVPSDITYNEWLDKYVKNIPEIKIASAQEKEYSKDELEKMAMKADEIVRNYSSNKSKWSGKINIKENVVGKEWNCSISVDKYTTQDMLIHEQLHARSISYYDRETYRKNWKIEESVVQLFTQEICKKENINFIESKYDKMVNILRKINKKAKLYDDDFILAKELFEIPVVERVDFLNEKLYNNNEKIKSIEEYQKISEWIESLR